ncbi:MAG: GNAT family N-acetyltransferase [Armatimonadetes bacterium]|nr:GNAT family N-acetyltransferase [Armatimonadota bacterium]
MKNYQWGNDRELINLAGMNPLPKSALDIDRWYETVHTSQDVQVYAIKTPDGDYLGNIELRDIDPRCGRAEVGIIIGDRQSWTQGYGADALSALCRFAFRELRFHRLYARVLENNPRAQGLFRKCGFKQEGLARESHFSAGRHWDVILFGLLSDELPEDPEMEASP